VLDGLLASLSDDAREVFVLFELEAMSTAGIAQALSLPMGTVASRLRRAREEFDAATKRFRARGGGR
jgi:RNA polymerase sigma-70 factor (ECF subfamily)